MKKAFILFAVLLFCSTARAGIAPLHDPYAVHVDGLDTLEGNWSLGGYNLTNGGSITATSFLATGTVTASNLNVTNWDTAYTHSQDNSQAHSDYLINNGDDHTSGELIMTKVGLDGGGAYPLYIAQSEYLAAAARTITLVSGDVDRTITLSGNPTLADWFNQSVKTTASPIFANPIVTGLTFDFVTNDYKWTERNAGTYSTMALQNQTTDSSNFFELSKKTATLTGSCGIQIYGYGIPTDSANREFLSLYWNGSTSYVITTAQTNQTVRPLSICTGDNTSQLVLGTNGNNSMGGDLDVTGSLSCGVHTLNLTQDYTFKDRGDAALCLQSQTDDAVCEFGLYSKKGDSGDNVYFRAFASGTPTALDPYESMIIGYISGSGYRIAADHLNGSYYPLIMDFSGGLSQLILGTDGNISMGGDLSVTGTVSGATGSTFGNLTLADGSITDTSGAISFGDENLSTTAGLTVGDEYYSADGNIRLGAVALNAAIDGGFQVTPNARSKFGLLLLDSTGGGPRVGFYVNASGHGSQYVYNSSDELKVYLNSSGNSYFLGGNVGFNDSSPAEKVDVNGNVNVTGVYKVGDDDGVSGTLELDDGATEKITLVFTGGILTSRTVAATTGSALADWTD